MNYPDEIRWARIIRNLKKSGMTLQEIAQETGFSVRKLWDMEAESYDTEYLSIIKLLDLHVSRCPEKHLKVGVQPAEI
jgi:lambda repressor-like predicted transcriptional regulator